MAQPDPRSDETKAQDDRVHRAIAAERARCAKVAEGVGEFWRAQAKEWESPKHDLDAEFVRRAAKHKADAADECAAAIRKLT